MKFIALTIVFGVVSYVTPQDVINNYCYGSPKAEELIAFSVSSKKKFEPSTWAIVPMEVMHYNDGGYYHTSDNRFYAPVDGVYFFTFSGHGQAISLHLYTQKPGQAKVMVARAADTAVVGQSSGSSASIMVKMVMGETAALWSVGGPSFKLHGAADPWGLCSLFTGRLEKRLD